MNLYVVWCSRICVWRKNRKRYKQILLVFVSSILAHYAWKYHSGILPHAPAFYNNEISMTKISTDQQNHNPLYIAQSFNNHMAHLLTGGCAVWLYVPVECALMSPSLAWYSSGCDQQIQLYTLHRRFYIYSLQLKMIQIDRPNRNNIEVRIVYTQH